MAEIDLVPARYRRLLQLQGMLLRFGMAALAVLLLLVGVQSALAYGVRDMETELERIDAARVRDSARQAELNALRVRHGEAERRVRIVTGLRGGVAAREMFRVIERASGGALWFTDWTFRRAGEVVDHEPKAVQSGYFLIVPLEGEGDERDQAWRMETHMEIRGRSVDHSTLAGFVRRLLEQPEIEQVRVIQTSTRTYTKREVVDFELAVVVKTAA